MAEIANTNLDEGEDLDSLLTSPTFPWEVSDSDDDLAADFPDEDVEVRAANSI